MQSPAHEASFHGRRETTIKRCRAADSTSHPVELGIAPLVCKCGQEEQEYFTMLEKLRPFGEGGLLPAAK